MKGYEAVSIPDQYRVMEDTTIYLRLPAAPFQPVIEPIVLPKAQTDAQSGFELMEQPSIIHATTEADYQGRGQSLAPTEQKYTPQFPSGPYQMFPNTIHQAPGPSNSNAPTPAAGEGPSVEYRHTSSTPAPPAPPTTAIPMHVTREDLQYYGSPVREVEPQGYEGAPESA